MESLSRLRERVESFGIKLDMVPLPMSSSAIERAVFVFPLPRIPTMHIAWAASYGCLDLHPWPTRRARLMYSRTSLPARWLKRPNQRNFGASASLAICAALVVCPPAR